MRQAVCRIEMVLSTRDNPSISQTSIDHFKSRLHHPTTYYCKSSSVPLFGGLPALDSVLARARNHIAALFPPRAMTPSAVTLELTKVELALTIGAKRSFARRFGIK